MLRLFVMVLLISPIGCLGQKNIFNAQNEDALFFWDGIRQKFVIIDDSICVQVFNETSNNWESESVNYLIDFTFHDFKKFFIPISREKNTTLFVHCGGGVVLEFKDNRITRIDKSFVHQNQYGGSFFTFRDEPYIFGGYGLFSFKDFLIRFDFNEKEWYKIVVKGIKPRPRRFSISFLYHDQLYVFGGEGEFDEKYTYLKDAWAFNFKSFKWEKLGVLNPKLPNFITKDESPQLSLSCEEQNLIVTDERIYTFLPEFNKAQIYLNHTQSKIRNIVQKGSVFLIKSRKQFTNSVEFRVEKSKDFLNDFVSEETFIYENDDAKVNVFQLESKIFIYIFFLVLGFIFLIIVFLKKKYHVFKKIEVLNTSEIEFLNLVKQSNNSGISLIHINDIIGFGNPSFETLKKRRELFLKKLKSKLAKTTNFPEKEIFIELRNDEDKRLKLIKINNKIYPHLDQILKSKS